MNKTKILDFIKKNKVAVGVVASILAVGILTGIGVGVHKLTSNNNDDNTLAVESNEEDNPHENKENESTASLNNEQATVENTENKVEDNKETSSDTTENNNTDKNISSENEQKDNKNQNKDKSESNKNVNAGIEISEGKTENKPSTGGTQNTDKTPSHSHSWKAVTKVVHHKEQGHYENVLVKPAWTENVPVYEEKAREICNDCNKDITDLSESNFENHIFNHIENGGKGSWRTEWRKVQVGTKPVKHDAVYKKKWVVDKKAWSETVITGYRCSCGATK